MKKICIYLALLSSLTGHSQTNQYWNGRKCAAAGVKGFLIEKDSTQKDIAIGDYQFTVHHEYKMGWSQGSKENTWPLAGGLIIAIAPDEFYVTGTGFVMTFAPKTRNKKAGFISIDESGSPDEW